MVKYWIAIYPVDSVIHPPNNLVLKFSSSCSCRKLLIRVSVLFVYFFVRFSVVLFFSWIEGICQFKLYSFSICWFWVNVIVYFSTDNIRAINYSMYCLSWYFSANYFNRLTDAVENLFRFPKFEVTIFFLFLSLLRILFVFTRGVRDFTN